EYGIDKDRLLVTVYHTDEEAVEIWKKHAGLPDDRILRIATDDNFWSAGPTGPCGPCTEIFYDHGEQYWGGPPGTPEEDGDRFVEIWNLVFMQYEQFEDGSRVELPNKSIDTGMGIERVAALLQGTNDNYGTDLIRALIEASADKSSTDPDGPGKTHHRVIADHLRSTSFLIADGVMPSNDGRGYVLRRIMRRAMRHAHQLGVSEPHMHKLVGALVDQMGAAYPELGRAKTLIEDTLLNEETRFRQTLERGLKLLADELRVLPEDTDLPGEAAFKLYDTYGFPLDLTQDALREQGRSVDTAGFDAAMAEQKAKARAAWSGSGAAAEAAIWFDIAEKHGTTDFLGYEYEAAEGRIDALVRDGAELTDASEGDEVQIVLNQTPFYAESGGQVGDAGVLSTTTGRVEVSDTKKAAGVFIHLGKVVTGSISAGQGAALEVSHEKRSQIRFNHSATHLLHEALRHALGDHVAQRGSLNAVDRLRFDFSHNQALTAGELRQVERDVNAYIRQNAPVETRIMAPDDARALGAQALFGEKYGDEVRVVSMGREEGSGRGSDGDTYSIELCGGTHVAQTGDIGVFVTLGDSASSAGVRRIEALTGAAAFDHLAAQNARLGDAALALNAPTAEVPARVEQLLAERKALQTEVADLRRAVAMGGGTKTNAPEMVGDVPFLAMVLEGVTGKDLPALIDAQKSEHGSIAVLLIADTDGKAAVAAGLTDDLAQEKSAVDLVKAAVEALGGKGGGGRPNMAQGGAKDASNAQAAIDAAKALLA
ncbi:MAG: alanine--tRNA ligase, partial [Pseudomonadota bacterium]